MRCIVLALSVFLLGASFDAVPDPPAVNPHAVTGKALATPEFAREFQVLRETTCLTAPPQFRFCELTHNRKPIRSRDPIVRAGHATDSSPPAA